MDDDMWPAVALAVLAALCACTCRKPEGPVTRPRRSPAGAKVVGFGDGAARLLLSPGERLAAVETRDDPAAVELIDVATGRVERREAGWAVGPPGDDGALLVLERVDDRRFRVRATGRASGAPGAAIPLEPPEGGRWRVEAAVGAGAHGVVVLRRGDRRWVASLARSPLAVRVATELDGVHGAVGPAVALTPTGDRLLLLAGGDGVFRVTALATADLEPAWSTPLVEPPAAEPAERTTGAPAIPVAVPPWGYLPGFLVVPSGDGARVLVVGGEEIRGGIHEPQRVVVLDAATGAVTSAGRLPSEGLGDVRAAAPVPGSPRVALLHVSRFREGQAETPTTRFGGVTQFDLATGAVAERLVVAELGTDDKTLKETIPSAITVTTEGTVLLVPSGG